MYRVDKHGDFSQVCESNSAQIFKITANGNGYFLIADNTAGILQVENSLNASGTYFSEIFDARIQSRFGRLTWNADPGPQAVGIVRGTDGQFRQPGQVLDELVGPVQRPGKFEYQFRRLPFPAGQDRAQLGQSHRRLLTCAVIGSITWPTI